MKSSAVLLSALLAGLSLGAVAQTDGTDTGTGIGGGTDTGMGGGQGGAQTQTFTELDQDNDGVLSEDELENANLSGDFDDIDANGDDEVDRNEYYQHQRQQR